MFFSAIELKQHSQSGIIVIGDRENPVQLSEIRYKDAPTFRAFLDHGFCNMYLAEDLWQQF